MKRKMIAAFLMVIAIGIPQVCYAGIEDTEQIKLVAMNGEDSIQPFYDKTYNISAGLKISGSTAYATANVVAKNVCNVNIVMRLQRKEGSSWHTIVSWVGGSDKGYKTLDKTHTLTTRGTYRVYAMFDVDGEKLEYVGNTATY